MTIHKVKYKKGTVEIMYSYTKEGKQTEYQLKSAEEPTPEFFSALQALREFVVEICELEETPVERINVLGVSFSYGGDEGTMGAVIVAQKLLQYSPSPLNINTPHKIENFYSESGGDELQLMSAEMNQALYELMDEAENYIKGARAQGDLFNQAS